MKKTRTIIKYVLVIAALLLASAGCEQGGAKLSDKEATSAFNAFFPDGTVKSVKTTPVKGIYEVLVEDAGRLGIVYMDSAGKHILTGSLLEVKTTDNITTERLYKITKVDFGSISLTNSLTMGAVNGTSVAVVFSDPSCMPCGLYHNELKKAVMQDKNLTIYIKPFPLPDYNESSYEKVRSIACAESNEDGLMRLAAFYAGVEAPASACETNMAEANMEEAERLRIFRSPTTIFSSGIKMSEAMRAETFLKELEKRSAKGTPAGK